VNADSGISIWDSPGTKVYHNTIIQNGTYPTAIEYRFAGTTGVEIANNLTDGGILRRDNAQAMVYSNFTAATPSMFVNAGAANLHLLPTATAAIDKGADLPDVQADWDGDPRGANGAWDLGADEIAAPPTSTNRPPVARATATPVNGQPPLAVSFSGAASTDPDGDPLTYRWTFGDGRSGAGVSATNTYAGTGNYTASLTVTDAKGATATATVAITVTSSGGGGSAPNTPSRLAATVSGRNVTLTWLDHTARETAYLVERATGSGAFAQVAQLPRNTVRYVNSSLSPGSYRYRVRAYDSTTGLYSAYSNILSVTVR
jgi:PKD repeat protein